MVNHQCSQKRMTNIHGIYFVKSHKKFKWQKSQLKILKGKKMMKSF